MNEMNLTKEDFWMKRIQDFQKSGLSRKEWCQENQVPLSTFSYWIRKQMQKPSELDQGMEPVFARLPSELEVSSQPLSEYPPITIHLPESIRIEVSTGCPCELMASLSYYSQPLHPHAQKQPAKPSAEAVHLNFLLMWVK